MQPFCILYNFPCRQVLLLKCKYNNIIRHIQLSSQKKWLRTFLLILLNVKSTSSNRGISWVVSLHSQCLCNKCYLLVLFFCLTCPETDLRKSCLRPYFIKISSIISKPFTFFAVFYLLAASYTFKPFTISTPTLHQPFTLLGDRGSNIGVYC